MEHLERQRPAGRPGLRAIRGITVCLLLLASAYALVLLAPPGSGGTTAGTNPPKGIHLSYLDDPTAAVLTWHTAGASSSRAEWGVAPGPPYDHAAAGTDYLAPNGTFLHTVTLTGLVPGVRYYYRVGDVSMTSRYGEASFRAAPVKGATDAFAFAAAGDWGDSTTTKNTALGIATRGVNLVLPIGDLYYSNSENNIKKVLEKWQVFGESAFVQMAMGNHEYAGDRYDTPTDTVCSFANLPGNERTYAFTYGNTFFLTVDWGFYSDLQSDGVDGSGNPCGGAAGTSAIRAWMNDQLTAANLNSKIQWKVVYQHFLCYGISGGTYNEFALCPNEVGIADQMEDILVKQKVDLVLEAHDHKYGRTHPVKFGATVQTGSTYDNPGAPVYILLGTGGAPNTGTCRTFAWIASCRAPTQTAGFGWFYVTPTAINFQFVENTAGVIDSFTLNKPVVTDFGISVDPSSGRMGTVESLTAAVSVRGVSADPVSLNVNGCPDAASCTLTPASGVPGFQSALTIITSNATPFGAYPLTITASNSTVSRSASFNLTVSTRQIRSYSKGDGGAFSETDDAYVYSGAATTNYGSATIMRVDGDCTLAGTVCRSLLKFPNLIGTSLGQIPVGSTIVSADLTLSVSNPSVGSQEVYRLTEAWTESIVTWNSFATAGSPATAGLSFTFTPTATGLWKLNVTSIVQAWANGQVNQGILLSSKNSDSAEYQSSESTKPPILSVTFDPPLAPLPFDFSTSLNPLLGTVNPGGTARTNVSVLLTSGATKPVGLRCDNLPANVTCSFSPPSSSPTFISAVTVATGPDTPLGTYPISIVGSDETHERSSTYNLTVAAPTTIATLSFRRGDGGSFSGTNDSYIYSGAPTTNYGRDLKMITDGDCSVSGTVCRSLLKFPDIIGGLPGQIPLGSTIISANLVLSVTNPSTGAQEVYRLTEGWAEYTVTWNGFATPGSPANAGLAFTFTPTTNGFWTLNVTSMVQAWAAGALNQGIMISSKSGDGANYESSESSNRPLLTVTFDSPKGPAPFDFSIALDASKGTVAPGANVTVNVTALLKSGSGETVGLLCGALPAEASCSFRPANGTPTYVSRATIATSPNATLGTYPIWIVGTNGGLVRQAEYDLTIANPPSQGTVTLTFRNGDGGAYSGSIDAYIYSGGATTNYGTPTNIRVDADCFTSGTVCKGLLAFPSFIGPNAGQVPVGSTIVSATIDLTITNPGSTQYAWQLTEAWTETGVTWNGFATPGSPQTKGSATTFGAPLGAIVLDITAFVQRWVAGDANDGILITTLSGDGVDYSTKESTAPPKLTVTFKPPLTSSIASSAEDDEHSHAPTVDGSTDGPVSTQAGALASLAPFGPISLLVPALASWILTAPRRPPAERRRLRRD